MIVFLVDNLAVKGLMIIKRMLWNSGDGSSSENFFVALYISG